MTPGFRLPRSIDSGLRQRLQDVAEAQSAVVRRDHLARLGMSRATLRSMLEAGRWVGHGAVVVAMHNGPLTVTQQRWAAVLNAGYGAALAARTAAAEAGLTGWPADRVEVLVVRGTVVPKGLGIPVKVHESRRFIPTDVHPARALPQVRMERALIDAAVWSRRPRTGCGLLAAGVQQRLTQPAALLDELAGAGKVRNRRIYSAALLDIQGGAQAMSEIDFLLFCRRNGLPRPILQSVRTDHAGRRRYLDATFRRRDGRLVRIEIDGALHLLVRQYWDDMSRGNELVIDGEIVIRFASYAVHANDPVVVDQLRRVLRLSGSPAALAS